MQKSFVVLVCTKSSTWKKESALLIAEFFVSVSFHVWKIYSAMLGYVFIATLVSKGATSKAPVEALVAVHWSTHIFLCRKVWVSSTA